jgi:hypothetical protein
MPISIHYHRFPSCGEEHNTACDGYPNGDVCSGPLGPLNPHAGEFACVHSGRAVSREQVFRFIEDNAREWFSDTTGKGIEFVVAGTHNKGPKKSKPN